ncbi:hypothetical protein [Alteromonas facilis]|uniref:hypothetical protein n=1 Tax=Alteromonas facilis TaxID=2048004 RepID=UPI000C287B71|nr:hypothetical protein [Alteromonas facilis]
MLKVMLKKTLFIALGIFLVVAYTQLSSFHTAIQKAFPIVLINAKESPTEAEEIIKSLFSRCNIEFQSTLIPEIYLKTRTGPNTYYRLRHLQTPVYQSIEPLIKELEHSKKANAHIYYLLETPTLEALKQLRLNIELNFKGAGRTSAFDRVTPILSLAVPLSSNRCELIESYILYTEHIFGGAGFLI